MESVQQKQTVLRPLSKQASQVTIAACSSVNTALKCSLAKSQRTVKCVQFDAGAQAAA